jgi:hypothetical protein
MRRDSTGKSAIAVLQSDGAQPRNVLHNISHVDHAVARNNTKFKIVDEREFLVCSLELLV